MVAAAVNVHASVETVFEWLSEVMDPEVPAVSVVDLGIIRGAQWQDGECRLEVTVTPTYSGCPATEVIAQSIRDTLHSHGVEQVDVLTRLSPAWTTDWMTPKGREALRAYGIAPPVGLATCEEGSQVVNISALLARSVAVPCPQCNSRRTRLLSQFGSTACKALYRCIECLEPFDYFKPH